MTRGPVPVTVAQIERLLLDEPNITRSEIAARLGLSKQRVSQVVTKHGLPVKSAMLNVRRTPPLRPRSVLQPSVGCANINHTIAGTIGELIVAADLLARGWQVFFPLVRTTRCDLLATSKDGQRVIRIEVRCGKRVSGRMIFTKKENAACDHFAVVIANEAVAFMPDLPESG